MSDLQVGEAENKISEHQEASTEEKESNFKREDSNELGCLPEERLKLEENVKGGHPDLTDEKEPEPNTHVISKSKDFDQQNKDPKEGFETNDTAKVGQQRLDKKVPETHQKKEDKNQQQSDSRFKEELESDDSSKVGQQRPYEKVPETHQKKEETNPQNSNSSFKEELETDVTSKVGQQNLDTDKFKAPAEQEIKLTKLQTTPPQCDAVHLSTKQFLCIVIAIVMSSGTIAAVVSLMTVSMVPMWYQNSNLNQQVAKLQSEIESMKTLSSKVEETVYVQEQWETATRRIEDAEDNFVKTKRALDDSVNTLERKLIETQTNVENAKNKLADTENNILETKHKLSETQNGLENTKHALNDTTGKLDQCLRETAELKNVLSNTNQSLNQAISEKNAEMLQKVKRKQEETKNFVSSNYLSIDEWFPYIALLGLVDVFVIIVGAYWCSSRHKKTQQQPDNRRQENRTTVHTPKNLEKQANTHRTNQHQGMEWVLSNIKQKPLEAKVGVVSFYQETSENHVTLTRSALRLDATLEDLEVVPVQIQGHPDLLQLPACKAFIMYVDYNQRNIILEDPTKVLGDLKLTTARAIQKMNADLILVYVGDRDSSELRVTDVFNPRITSVQLHQDLKEISAKKKFISINTDFAQHQKKHICEKLRNTLF